MKIDKELLKGSTAMLILNLLEYENMYGYQMIKKLSEKSENVFELKEGTLYPILHALEEKGLITSYWDESTSKKRKYYSITGERKEFSKRQKGRMENFQHWSKQSVGRCFICKLKIF